jgi:hypothetical protein
LWQPYWLENAGFEAHTSGIADSDDLARVYRFDLAQDSEMISPTITILMSPGA